MRKRPDVRSHCHRNACGQLLAKIANVHIENLLFALPSLRGCAVRCKILLNGKRGYGENMLLAHHSHGFVAKLKCMIDGYDSGLGCKQSARICSCMNCDMPAQAFSLMHSGTQLCFAVLIRRKEPAIVNRICAGLINLDEVRSLL